MNSIVKIDVDAPEWDVELEVYKHVPFVNRQGYDSYYLHRVGDFLSRELSHELREDVLYWIRHPKECYSQYLFVENGEAYYIHDAYVTIGDVELLVFKKKHPEMPWSIIFGMELL